MIGDSEERAPDADSIQPKQEGPERTNHEKGAMARTTSTAKITTTASSSSSRQWSAFRNPRIVRVSKAFGGKDRHSKVFTIRGLRDRRIRLSVPTAVQLYDLQDKLGLGQPSKVIDWLLEASKEDIDHLPPLELPQGIGHHHLSPQQMLLPSFHDPGWGGMLGHGPPFMGGRHGIHIHESLVGVDRLEGRGDKRGSLTLGGSRMTPERDSGKGKWVDINEGQSSYGTASDFPDPSESSQHVPVPVPVQVSAQNLFPIAGYSLSGLPYGYSTPWEPSSLSLSHFGSHGLQLFQSENDLPVAASHASSSSTSGLSLNPQLYFYSPAAATPLFPSYPHPQPRVHPLQTPSSLVPSATKYIHQEGRDDEDQDGDS